MYLKVEAVALKLFLLSEKKTNHVKVNFTHLKLMRFVFMLVMEYLTHLL